MSAPLSRADRRRLQRLTDANEPSIQADRCFFARRPERQHRLRLASTAECEMIRLFRPDRTAQPGFRWYVAMRQLAPGVRLRVFTLGFDGLDTDVPEHVAADVYDTASGSGAAVIEEHLREAMVAGRSLHGGGAPC